MRAVFRVTWLKTSRQLLPFKHQLPVAVLCHRDPVDLPLIMRGIGASKNSLTALLRVPGKRCQEFYSQG